MALKQNKIKNEKLSTINKPAFTLIEALTVLFIFSLITVTFYSVFSLGTRYIQDAKNRRDINADAKLKVVFGGKGKVNMFEMTKLVSKHLS